MIPFKKNLKWLIPLVIIASSTGCSTSLTDKEQAAVSTKSLNKDDKPYIGFALDTLKEERWYKDKKIFEDEVKELGGKVKTLAANGIDDVQIKQAELLIEEGVDVLVVVPHDAEASAKIVDMAHKANIKVISYDRLIKNADVDYYISFDNEKVGELQAAEITKRVPKGNYVYIGGAESDNNAILFRKGAMKVLQPYLDKGDIKLVYDKYTDEWKPQNAEANMKEAIKASNGNIQAVVAANDGTAGGVINALSSVNKSGKVPVSGQDAELNGIKRIVSGKQTMTVYKSINQIAEQAAELAIKTAKNEKITTDTTVDNGKIDVPSILLEPVPVTKETIDETVIKDGHFTKEEVYSSK